MAEFGIVVAKGLCNITKLEAILADQSDDCIPNIAGDVLSLIFQQMRDLNEKIDALERSLRTWHKTTRQAKGLRPFPALAL